MPDELLETPSETYEPLSLTEPYLPNTAIIRGWPGYRTANDKLGFDYFDTQAEWAHMQGVFYGRLLTGKLRTTNPLYLALMGFVGVCGVLPIGLAVFETWQGGFIYPGAWLYFGYYGVVGGLLLLNFARHWMEFADNEDEDFEGAEIEAEGDLE